MRSHIDEFPLLPAIGLYAADIRGDGNCLFNALSDQIYGDQASHGVIRARVIEHMREHADYYKQFIDVHPGGGIRRNPKRKNVSTYSTSVNAPPPSSEDVDRVFESHIKAMAQGGTYGDNMEITAFSSAFGVDVKIYQREFAYMVTGGANGQGEDGEERERPVAHIAYHTWEHYSSVRNLDGPHDGLPEVSPKLLGPEEEARQRGLVAQPAPVLPWQIEAVTQALPTLANIPLIAEAIKNAGGNIDAAVSALLEDQEYASASASSAQESSSIEREHDSDDDMHPRPVKKQDRRMSRNTKRSADSRHALSNLSVYDGSQESVGSWEDSETSSLPDSTQQSAFTPASFDSTDPPSAHMDHRSTGDHLAPRPTIRLKLSAPRPPESRTTHQQRVAKTSQRPLGPRVSTRDRKDIRKRAQKAARKAKEREEAATYANPVDNRSPTETGLALREEGLTETPPVETLRTLYI